MVGNLLTSTSMDASSPNFSIAFRKQVRSGDVRPEDCTGDQSSSMLKPYTLWARCLQVETGIRASSLRTSLLEPMTEFGSSAGSHQSTNVSLAPPAMHLLTYYGHHSAVYLVAWSPVGKYLASGDLQGSIQVWEALTGKRLLTYTAHLDWVDSVAWSPGGKAIASGDAGGSVDVWNATNGQRNSRLMLLPR